jgi:hypothetical protein
MMLRRAIGESIRLRPDPAASGRAIAPGQVCPRHLPARVAIGAFPTGIVRLPTTVGLFSGRARSDSFQYSRSPERF